MKITKTSSFSNIEHTLDIDITPEQLNRHAEGELIQNICPHLTPAKREFIISGVTEQEWNDLLNEREQTSMGIDENLEIT